MRVASRSSVRRDRDRARRTRRRSNEREANAASRDASATRRQVTTRADRRLARQGVGAVDPETRRGDRWDRGWVF
jgi:hypothetical protein